MSQTQTLEKMKTLRLTGMVTAWKNLLETRNGEQLSPQELLAYLMDAEWLYRQDRQRERLTLQAGFRYMADITAVDYTTHRHLDKDTFIRLSEGKFIEKGENLLIVGPTGVGKSYLATALGRHACQLGFKVQYVNMRKLWGKLKAAQADNSYFREMRRLSQKELLILDDFGLEVLDQPARLMFLEILEDRHGQKSTLICSQLPVREWYACIGDNNIADAILDRLVHTAHRIELTGESMRKSKTKN